MPRDVLRRLALIVGLVLLVSGFALVTHAGVASADGAPGANKIVIFPNWQSYSHVSDGYGDSQCINACVGEEVGPPSSFSFQYRGGPVYLSGCPGTEFSYWAADDGVQLDVTRGDGTPAGHYFDSFTFQKPPVDVSFLFNLGDNQITAHVVDRMGPEWSMPYVCLAIPLDTQPPITVASANKADHTVYSFGQWTNQSVTVSLSASDQPNPGGWGVKATYYTVDDGATQTYGGPFVLTTEGHYVIQFWSVDNANNVEDRTRSQNTVAVWIDKTPPSAPVASFAPGAVYNDGTINWYKDQVTVSFSDSTDPNLADGTPGSDHVTYSGPETFDATGTYSYSGTAGDLAGNVSSATTGTVGVDATPPQILCAQPDGQWHPTDITLTCQASDQGAGLANPSDVSFTLSTDVPDGTETADAYTESHQVCDLVGHCVTAGPIGGNMIDKKPPVTTASGQTAAGQSYTFGSWTDQAVTVTLSAVDGGSGVGTTYYAIDTAGCQPDALTACQTYATPVTLSDLGPHTISYFSVDKVGNLEAMHQVSVNLFAYATGGQFVVGDQSAGANPVGATVTFWSAKWWMDNALTSSPRGAGPAAFKGFVDTNASPAIGSTWTSSPGNSGNPPASVPEYLGVILSSSVSQSGSVISGNVVNIMVVKVEPGYQGNPGHAGIGTIVGEVTP